MATSVRKGFVYVNIILVNNIRLNWFHSRKLINLKKKKKKKTFKKSNSNSISNSTNSNQILQTKQ